MATQHDGSRTNDSGDLRSSRAALRIEMRAREPQVLTSLRDSFLHWVNDQTSGRFPLLAGLRHRISLDELESEAGEDSQPTLCVSVDWVSPENDLTKYEPLATTPPDKFVFFPDPGDDAPLYRIPSAPLSGAYVQSSIGRDRPLRHVPDRPVQKRARKAARASLAGLATTYRSVREVASRLTRLRPAMPRPWFEALHTGARIRSAVVIAVLAIAALTAFGATLMLLPAQSEPTVQLTRAPRATIPLSSSVAPPQPPLVMAAAPATVLERDPYPSDRNRRSARVSQTSTPAAAVPVGTVLTKPDRAARSHRSAPRAAAASPRAPSAAPDRANPQMEAVSGTLLVKSEPEGAEVSINGVLHGRTPVTIHGLPAGSRVVRLELPGYERWSWAVTVRPNRSTPVSVKLQPEGRRAGTYD
jgi:hypothetical protein